MEPLGIIDVQHRIGEIEARFGVAPARATVGTDATAAADASFSSQLAAALGVEDDTLLQPAGFGGGTAGGGLGSILGSTAVPGLDAVTSAYGAVMGAQPVAAALTGVPSQYRAAHSKGAVPVPDDFRSHGNGRIPADRLQPIGHGSHRLAPEAAAGFRAMDAAARAAGVEIGVTDSYRSYDAQVDVARRKGIYGQGGWAAVPGTSNHGWGFATDLDLDSRALAWMRDNAWRYGFVEDTPREPWHWTYRPA